MNLAGVTQEIVEVIVRRAAMGKDYGVILLPEGLVEFIPEVQSLLAEINELLAAGEVEAEVPAVADALTTNNAALFEYLPASIKMQMLAERDPHGNVQVSKIETEQLLHETVSHELNRLRRSGRYAGERSPRPSTCSADHSPCLCSASPCSWPRSPCSYFLQHRHAHGLALRAPISSSMFSYLLTTCLYCILSCSIFLQASTRRRWPSSGTRADVPCQAVSTAHIAMPWGTTRVLSCITGTLD